MVEMVEKKLNLESASLLADLGAGSGAFASHLSTRVGSVACPDISVELFSQVDPSSHLCRAEPADA